MRTNIIKLLLKKELMDVFRDRKAVIMLVLIPILIYPIIFFGSFTVMTLIQSNMEKGEYKILIETEDDGDLIDQINLYNKSKKNRKSENDSLSVIRFEDAVDDYLEENKNISEEDFSEESHQEVVDRLLQGEAVDVYVDTQVDEEGTLIYRTRFVSSITDSDYAETLVKDVLDELADASTRKILTDKGLDADKIMRPFDIERNNIASQEQSIGSILGMILPFMLIISLLMGTMYPAIDATAGEKERGTLETLLTLPIKNHEIIIAKFFTVALMGIISAFLNMISMAVMILYMVKLVSSDVAGNLGLNLRNFRVGTFVPAMTVTILAVLAFSLFISAVTMCITAFAKSYKEANNYITPLTLVVMLTGYIGFIPNIELTKHMALVPVANICLLIKELLLFKAEMGTVVIVLLSNIFYAAFAIFMLSRIYDSESIMFDEGKFGLQLFQRRINMEKGGVPTPGDAWFIIFFVFIVYLLVGSILQLEFGVVGVFASQMIILMLPLAFAIYTKKNLKKTYSIKGFRITDIVAAILLYSGVFIFENIVSNLISVLFPQQYEATDIGLEQTLMGDNIWFTILVVALAPAICEELLFRGFIQSGFKNKYRPVTGIILVSLVFGAYHTSFIRFIPTAMLGGCFAVILYYTESIFLTMIMHFINNTLAVLFMYYPGFFERTFPILSSTEMSVFESVIVTWIGVLMVTAAFLTFRTPPKVVKKRERKGTDAEE
ncbi:MAG: ABC transporter permease [Eubacterium sp.]|nr:ABC transporter permease [Eubacterium sp.]